MRNRSGIFKRLLLLIILSCISVSGKNLSKLFAADFYWENPQIITDTDSRFPVTVTGKDGKSTFLFWQEVDVAKHQIYLSVRQYKTLKNYSENRRFAGPFSYSGDEVPDLYTVSALKKGTVGVAVMTGLSNLSVFVSDDECMTFTETKIPAASAKISLRPAAPVRLTP